MQSLPPRSYLSPSEFATMRDQATAFTRQLADGDVVVSSPSDPHKDARTGSRWRMTYRHLSFSGIPYIAPSCDPTPRGIPQSFASPITSTRPAVPYSVFTHGRLVRSRFAALSRIVA